MGKDKKQRNENVRIVYKYQFRWKKESEKYDRRKKQTKKMCVNVSIDV